MGRQRKLSLLIVLAAGLLSAQSALGLTFNLTSAAGMPQNAIDGFTEAGQRWSSVLSDNVTINIDIDYTALAAGVLGTAGSSSTTYTYANTRIALLTDVVSANDTTATSNLQSGPAMSFLLNLTSNNPNGAGSSTPYLDNGNGSNNTFVRMNYANAKATGQRSAANIANDASITFSNAFAWDFDAWDGITPGTYDFVGIAAHEIGHALGFVSGVDELDNSAGASEASLVDVKTMDLFRYSAQSFGNGSGIFDWTADTRSKYFSIDGGATNLTTFSTGVVHGDGRQASHWKDSLSIGIMDPTAASGELLTISAFDRQMMDVIGWQLNNTWHWLDPTGSTFNSGVRWSSGAVPQATEDAVWDVGGIYGMAFTAAHTTKSATLKTGIVTYSLGGFAYTVVNAVYVAPDSGDVATLRTTGGNLLANSVQVAGDGLGAGGIGILVVDGGNLNVTNAVHVWNGGELIYNGGNISAASIILTSGKITTNTNVNNAIPISQDQGDAYIDTNGFNSTFGAITGGTNFTIYKVSPGMLQVPSVRTTGYLALNNGTLRILPNGLAAGVSKVTNLLVGGGAKLDLTDNKLITSNPVGTQTAGIYDGVQGLVQSGYGSGIFDGPTGIVTSQADATNGSGLTTIGVSTGALARFLSPTDTELWGGQTIDGNSTMVMYTYIGDANLDGFLDGTDYFYIDNGASTPGADGFANGDFNYDGAIDSTDYFYIDNGIALGLPQIYVSGGSELLAGAAAVPEPGGLIFLAGALAAFGRRNRCRL